MAFKAPSSAISVAVRPIDKGMILDQPSQAIPDGALVDCRNFIASKEGLYRRPGYRRFAGGVVAPYRALDYITLWGSDGSQESLLITERTLWRVNPVSMTEIPWVRYNTGTVTVVGLTVTGTGTDWATADVLAGDILRIGTTEGIIKEVTAGGSIVLESSNMPDQIGSSYEILATFTPGVISVPDWTVYDGSLIITDGKRPPIEYNATTQSLDYWVDNPGKYPATGEFIAACVTSFQDRIWFGYTVDAIDGEQRQRFRWSSLSDPRNFSIPTNYLDLPYVNGALKRIVAMGQFLMAYFEDAVFKGTLTNYPLLPVRFDPVETGGIGLIGPKAITSYLGGHFWVGQDDMYVMNAEGAQRIGSPVIRETIKKCEYYGKVYVAVDPWNHCVVFGLPRDQDHIQRLWRYEYRSGVWSYEDRQADLISNPVVNTTLDWNDLSGTWDNLGNVFATWDAMDLRDPRRLLFYAWAGVIWKQDPALPDDDSVGPISAEFTTRDFDFNEPDALKTWVRLGVKIDRFDGVEELTTFAVQVSTNRGRTWKAVGNLVIGPTFDEGYVNFRATGSTCRFRLVTASTAHPYRIVEYVQKVRLHGQERDVSTQI